MLYETFYKDLVLMDKKSVSDGMGGFTVEWIEGATFKGAVVTEATTEERVAEQQLGGVSYQITTPINVVLSFGDIVKNGDDYLKVTSDNKDVETPKVSTFKFKQCTAIKWELPN